MSNQSIAIIINLCVFLLVIAGTLILVRKLKFENNNSRVIFLLYIVYWVAPLLCRDYTASMHTHMGIADSTKLMWIPIAAFGAIGILWRPLNDILTYKTKSRKLIIYLSIVIEILTMLPFLLYPCFATNIIQSVGAGIGASGIGLFTLMFNEGQTRRNKKFLTISIFALPPIIAGFIVSAIESFISSYTPKDATVQEYSSVIWYIWLIALIFILISFVMTFFVTEKRETLYQDKQYKEPVVKASGNWKMILLCICGVCLALVRWATAGPYAGLELTYIAKSTAPDHDITLWDGYLGLAYTFGCLIGSLISAWAIIKSNSNKYQPIIVSIAIAIWITYICIVCKFVNIPVYFWLEILNGIGFGLMWNIFLQIVLNKFYVNRDIITPIGFYNMSLSIGIVLGSIFIGFTKANWFDVNTSVEQWSGFINVHNINSYILLGISGFLFASFMTYYGIESKTKTRRKLSERKVAMIGENEI